MGLFKIGKRQKSFRCAKCDRTQKRGQWVRIWFGRGGGTIYKVCMTCAKTSKAKDRY